jgi:hypothetical protein
MSIKLVKAFKVTEEEHADAFERFANAFLVDDYPELKALGGKKDKGMDAYIYDDEAAKAVIVLRSCVSPASRARTKVLGTIKKLEDNNLRPEIFIYCTSDNGVRPAKCIWKAACPHTPRRVRVSVRITFGSEGPSHRETTTNHEPGKNMRTRRQDSSARTVARALTPAGSRK